jgi:hypothetical protein
VSNSSLSDSTHESGAFPPFTPGLPIAGGKPLPPADDQVEEIQDFEEFEEVDQFEELEPEPPAAPAPQPTVTPSAVASTFPETPPVPPVVPPPVSKAPPAPPVKGPPPKVVEPKAPPVKSPAADPLAEIAEEAIEPRRIGNLLRNSSAMTVSMIVHLALLIALSYFVVEPAVTQKIMEVIASVEHEPEVKEELKVELENQLVEVNERTPVMFSSSMEVGEAVGASGPAGMQEVPPVEKAILDQMVKAGEVTVEGLFIDTPSSKELIVMAPDGQVGDARAVVDDYNEALDRITQELLWMLDKGPVLVIWAFDQSESMKDDQREIRDRIEHVYRQLGLVSSHNRDALQTAVVSYGEGYIQHTRQPTSDWYEIRACIDEVPTDPSGKEMMCSAVTQAISTHRAYAQRQNRQMCLILCTDESGEPEDNQRNLERAIAEAKAAGCKIYVIGREAVFGYPYAHIRWEHPQTGHHHWIRIDRGPETAFIEQLQTDGFHRRYDAHPSGFGPYEQTRMGHETGGIFFMLPSLESNLVRGEKRKYELEAMRMYLPDIRSRQEVYADIEKSELRMSLMKNVIYKLNPYDPEVAKIIVMRVDFSRDLPTLIRQIDHECAKATIYGTYLAMVEKEMERLKEKRRHEDSPRWQANYDLIYAQIVAYQARMYEYRAALLQFKANPKVVPLTKPPNLTHTGWDIATRKETITQEVKPYMERATAMFQAVINDHPGTPWAARAEYELKRGFGIHLVPEYHGPYRSVPPGTQLIPVPKM